MNPKKIEDNELLYRVVRQTDPDGFIDGKPTAALFMDPQGLSVDRDGGRTESKIIDTFKKRFNRYKQDYKTAFKISANTCRSFNTYPVPAANKSNKFHAEIHESKEIIPISLFKAIQLANLCKEVTDEP